MDKAGGKGVKSAANLAKSKQDQFTDLRKNVEFAKIEKNEMEILAKHGNGEYEEALELLEESQRIVKTHYGT